MTAAEKKLLLQSLDALHECAKEAFNLTQDLVNFKDARVEAFGEQLARAEKSIEGLRSLLLWEHTVTD